MTPMKKVLLILMVLTVYVLHQDFWNWLNAHAIFGFIPVGLAYHAGFSVLCAAMMAVLVKCAWPHDLEVVEPTKPSDPDLGPDNKAAK